MTVVSKTPPKTRGKNCRWQPNPPPLVTTSNHGPASATTPPTADLPLPKIAPRRPKRLPRGPQDGPRGPQNGPRGAQDSPREPQDGPKRGPRGGTRTENSSLPPEEAPRRPQEAFEPSSMLDWHGGGTCRRQLDIICVRRVNNLKPFRIHREQFEHVLAHYWVTHAGRFLSDVEALTDAPHLTLRANVLLRPEQNAPHTFPEEALSAHADCVVHESLV